MSTRVKEIFEIVAECRMLFDGNGADAVLLVEGPDDKRILERHLSRHDGHRVQITFAGNRDTLIRGHQRWLEIGNVTQGRVLLSLADRDTDSREDLPRMQNLVFSTARDLVADLSAVEELYLSAVSAMKLQMSEPTVSAAASLAVKLSVLSTHFRDRFFARVGTGVGQFHQSDYRHLINDDYVSFVDGVADRAESKSQNNNPVSIGGEVRGLLVEDAILGSELLRLKDHRNLLLDYVRGHDLEKAVKFAVGEKAQGKLSINDFKVALRSELIYRYIDQVEVLGELRACAREAGIELFSA